MKRALRFAGGALLVSGSVLLAAVPGWADDHVVSELRRSYMGRTFPVQPSEVWLGADRTYVRDGAVVIITRSDLAKRWIILPGRKKYLEEAWPVPVEKKGPQAPVRLQEYGFDYEPGYEWTVRETQETATFGGLPCRKYVVRGDAEYAEEVREMWVAESPPIDAKAYFERVVKPGLDPAWLKIYQNHTLLRRGLVMRSVTTAEPAIASTTVVEVLVTKLEDAPPPAGIYDLPGGLRKVATRAELYAR
jgi:hypothetical protein